MRQNLLSTMTALAALLALAACSQTEPSERQMREAIQAVFARHTELPGMAGIKVKTVKKGSCSRETKADGGVHCTFSVKLDGPAPELVRAFEALKEATFKYRGGRWEAVEDSFA